VRNPLRSEEGAFQMLLLVGAIALAVVVVVLILRAL
jgi:hypothetical protein